MGSIKYWNDRYGARGNSGAGSRGASNEYKVRFVNSFIKKESIDSVLDFGSGDLKFAKKIDVPLYFGLDCANSAMFLGKNEEVKPKELKLLQTRFDSIELDDKFDLVICLDVFYHILADEQEYLRSMIDNMINYAKEYIVVFSLDSEEEEVKNRDWLSVPHCFNSPWREIFREYEDKGIIKYCYDDKGKNDPAITGSTYFFVFEKV